MLQFYLMFQKGAPLAQQLSNLTWSHYSLILPLKELGIGFTYVGSEVKIKIGDTYNYIDFLFFNTNYNCYVVIELKVTKLKSEHLGQITKYINYVNKNIKKSFHDNTAGVIICKKENKFVMEYCTNPKLFTTTYKTS